MLQARFPAITVFPRILILMILLGVYIISNVSAAPLWTSPNHYRVMLTVNPGIATRKNSPVSTRIDFPQLLANMGAVGEFDEYTIEVFAYNAFGQPKVFDSSRLGYEQYLLPHYIDKYFAVNFVTLNFVMPDNTYTQYAVYFDTKESCLGNPLRYTGLVGNGDWFREEHKRREINACKLDHFVDWDGDGDLDLFKGGVEPYVYCYENVGENKFEDRGRLTTAGDLFTVPRNTGNNRSWVTVAFYDWDNDGDLDFIPSFADGPDAGKFVFFENTTTENGGVLTFTRVGYLSTTTGTLVGAGATQGIFPAVTFVQDWDGDGDGRTDIIVGFDNHCYLYRCVGYDASGNPRLADKVAIKANGSDIILNSPRFDVADIDSDGDLDLFAGTMPGPVYWYRNTGTRTNPVFAAGVVVAYGETYMIGDLHASLKIADWDGDGLLDFVAGRFWERTAFNSFNQPRYYGGLYKNVGTPTSPVFERRDENEGSPYTERFQICDAVRQNGVRTVDWNNDGKPDLIAGDTDGFVWYFRNLTNRLFPVFATGERLLINGQPLSLWVSGGGHARPDITDWNNDGKKDLIAADSNGYVTLFLNTGTDANPILSPGTRVYTDGAPIDGASRSSVLVCDWNSDGKKDIIFADDTYFKFYRNTNTDANPVFAIQSSLTIDPSDASFNRPNMGSWLDWDGDGKKDMVGCEFENSIRLYKNRGTNTAPSFSNSNGDSTIYRAFTAQMISGADAKDWNNDGDVDILTGQGHAGSGLRFFERDYLNDWLTSSYPTVATGSSEHGLDTGQAKLLGNGGSALIPRGLVTAAYTDYFYMESPQHVSGVRV
ncbi:MAG: VCBS repeat-containing protein, partial [Armatimonadota bacterium]|nr:VCBS repeat-containing protein [Armatimonadota bacterium]